MSHLVNVVKTYNGLAIGLGCARVTQEGDGNSYTTTIELWGDQFDDDNATKKIVVIGQIEWESFKDLINNI